MDENKPTVRRTDRADDTGTDLIDELRSLRKPLAGDVPISELIDPLVREGELYEALPDGSVHCFACGHNCKIKPGARGICQVRYNLGGKLRVPWGYVSGLQSDPTEKKPFYHVHPGSDTLTFGMLGCDLHCSYCFTGDTTVVTNHGPISLSDLFDRADHVEQKPDGVIAYPKDLRAVAASGTFRSVRAVFKHPYRGRLAVIQPYYLPALRCTPDHRIYATDDVARPPVQIRAEHLTKRHFLAIPRQCASKSALPQVIDVAALLGEHQVTYRVPWGLTVEQRTAIAEATLVGATSREIGASLGKSGSYIRHVRSKIARGLAEDVRTRRPILEPDSLRFPNEHRPGLPIRIPLDSEMARLLGYYCAEGCVVSNKKRPNSHTLNFSFSHQESALAKEVGALLEKRLGVEAKLVHRETTLGVYATKASAALLFKSLAGECSDQKQVPALMFTAPRQTVEAFLQAYVEGDGHHYVNGKVSVTTVSRRLAYGIAWLVLQLGNLPSVYDTPMPESGQIQGRAIKRSTHQYTIVWYEHNITRKVVETDDYYLIPLRDITFTEYDGDVYNMEVEEEHNYLAGLLLVSNCQNWDISQALRDANAGRPPARTTPEQMVSLALRHGAKNVASSYNEPLITSEWAVAVFKQAKAKGLTCLYVSNGNATPQVLEYIRPFTDGYKIDLKTMNDKNYRKLGAVLDNVLDTVRLAHKMGFWVEIVTLVVPGFNDSEQELRDAAQFIKSVSPDIPWHVTAFHKDYRMHDPANTDARTLIRAAEIGQAEGLHYVYAGNLPGRIGTLENTFCPSCHATLIERLGYVILDYQITPEGTCPRCQTKIAGIWPKSKDEVRLGTTTDLFFRVPRQVR
jgi:pyruvate formate lyase activating enzyme